MRKRCYCLERPREVTTSSSEAISDLRAWSMVRSSSSSCLARLGGSRHRSEDKACPCGLWPGELPDHCAQCRALSCPLPAPRVSLPLGHLSPLF